MEDAEKLDLRAQECQRALLILQAGKKKPQKDNLNGSYQTFENHSTDLKKCASISIFRKVLTLKIF